MTAHNRVWRVRWRRSTWATRTASRVRIFGYEKPALYLAQRLLGENFRVEIATARRGMWEPVALPEKGEIEVSGRTCCTVCGGSGLILSEIEELCRPCPPCHVVAS